MSIVKYVDIDKMMLKRWHVKIAMINLSKSQIGTYLASPYGQRQIGTYLASPYGQRQKEYPHAKEEDDNEKKCTQENRNEDGS